MEPTRRISLVSLTWKLESRWGNLLSNRVARSTDIERSAGEDFLEAL